ncbi:hypothetical protein EVAR_33099_1 [Eumeta japonica]|uniref:Uncharacterized protein n=1 Tax=Eumeta variegata TaxID=151549 RepID=A0A4C1Y912_EUMVA|nr:hypothetical protein EVAR_33099_1 [Eumeta japonica]
MKPLRLLAHLGREYPKKIIILKNKEPVSPRCETGVCDCISLIGPSAVGTFATFRPAASGSGAAAGRGDHLGVLPRPVCISRRVMTVAFAYAKNTLLPRRRGRRRRHRGVNSRPINANVMITAFLIRIERHLNNLFPPFIGSEF